MMALVTGGASCGKSAYAEQLACSLPGKRYYLAAMRPFGEEGARRVKRHLALRAGKGFETIECFDGFQEMHERVRSATASAGTTALLESLGNVVANEMFAEDGSSASYEEALQAVLDDVSCVADLFDNLVIVGDEVGGDGLCYDESTETFIRIIGAASCAIAAQCDLVVECVAGQPFIIKGDAPQRCQNASEGTVPSDDKTHRRGQSPAMHY